MIGAHVSTVMTGPGASLRAGALLTSLSSLSCLPRNSSMAFQPVLDIGNGGSTCLTTWAMSDLAICADWTTFKRYSAMI